MKLKKIAILLLGSFLWQSCYKEGTITVENQLKNATITNVGWGRVNFPKSIPPEDISEEVTVYKYDEVLPQSNPLSFRMEANQKVVTLQTVEEYSLDEGGSLLIVIDSNTAVADPEDLKE